MDVNDSLSNHLTICLFSFKKVWLTQRVVIKPALVIFYFTQSAPPSLFPATSHFPQVSALTSTCSPIPHSPITRHSIYTSPSPPVPGQIVNIECLCFPDSETWNLNINLNPNLYLPLPFTCPISDYLWNISYFYLNFLPLLVNSHIFTNKTLDCFCVPGRLHLGLFPCCLLLTYRTQPVWYSCFLTCWTCFRKKEI